MNVANYQTICLVNIFFGKLPDYFNLWLNSCRYNETIDFLIFTDDKTEYDYPKNVKVIYTTFEEIRKQIQKYFDFKISLQYIYKLCDYKPIYGYVFSEYLKEYDFWGNCDLDTIFGDLRKHLSEKILKENDKIYQVGHFTLYKNQKRINENFKELINQKTKQPLYEEVFKNNGSYYFDEWAGVINLYDGTRYKMYKNTKVIADISIKYNNFIVLSNKENGNYIFNWKVENDTSKLYGIYIKDNQIKKQEFMYIHLQKRNMEVKVENQNEFFIVPNKFICLDEHNIETSIKQYNYRFTLFRKEYLCMRIKRLYQKIFRKGKKTI